MPHALAHLERGTLVLLLPRWYADAMPISLYFAGQRLLPAKTRVFIDLSLRRFASSVWRNASWPRKTRRKIVMPIVGRRL
jgi:DNA-binding transcriptional LysR family regulator